MLTNSHQADEQSNNLERELLFCLEDKADIIEPNLEEVYTLSSFGIYSPLLENKKVNKTEFKFKRAHIVSRTIQIDDNVSVTSWTLENSLQQYLPRLPERLDIKTDPLDPSYKHYDFPILDGYEFQDYVTDEKFISSRIPESSASSKVYITERGIKMFMKALACPQATCGAELYFYTNTNHGKTQLFVQITKRIDVFDAQTVKAKNLSDAFTNLKEVADSLSSQVH